jgi:hypothetical protein
MFAQLALEHLEIRQLNYVCLYAQMQQHFISLIKRRGCVFKDVQLLLLILEHLEIMKQEFVKAYAAHSKMDQSSHMQIHKLIIVIVFFNAPRALMNHLQILQLEHVCLNAQQFQIYMVKLSHINVFLPVQVLLMLILTHVDVFLHVLEASSN